MFKISIFKHEDDADKLRSQYHGKDSLPIKVSIKVALRMLKLYWTDKDSIPSWILLSIIVILTSGAIYLAKVFNTWYKDFWDTVQKYDLPGFKYQLMMFAILATIHVIVSVYNAYLRSKLAINWRQWLTKKVMHDYLGDNTYYKMQLEDRKTENPDQRISEDLSSFVSLSISLILGTLSDLAMLGTFAVVLWDLSYAVDMTLWNGFVLHLPDGYMLYLAIAYALVGTILTFIIGKPLVRLNFRQQRYEADFRFSLIRVRENSESISLYQGEQSEEQILKLKFTDVVKNYVRLIKREKVLGFFTLGYAQTAVIFPMLIAAPMYFAKVITIGSIMQISSAFGKVQDSLSTVIQSFSSWASYKAVVDRLALFFDSMDASTQIECLKSKDTVKDFALEHLEVKDPKQDILWQDLSINLTKGQSLLVRGPSGCGKSTLIKTIAGIWPHATGDIQIPSKDKVLFLSQRPYLPQGSLFDAACYPGEKQDESKVAKLFEELRLDYLLKDLHREDNWSSMLSLGEQQRIAIIRALLLKPDLLIMDEASSALDEAIENTAYNLIKQELSNSIILSVGHRSSLIKMHDLILLSKGSGKWQLENSKEFVEG